MAMQLCIIQVAAFAFSLMSIHSTMFLNANSKIPLPVLVLFVSRS